MLAKSIQSNKVDYFKLLEGCQKKQKNALHALFKAESSAMLDLAFEALKNHQFAEQTVINTFLSISDNAIHYEEELGSAKGWIYSILRFHIRQTYQNHYESLAQSLSKEPGFKTADLHALHSDLHPNDPFMTFYEAFEQLPKEMQNAIITMYLSPDTQAHVASRLGIPLGRLREEFKIAFTHLAKHLPELPQHDYQVVLGEYALGGLNDSVLDEVNKVIDHDDKAASVLLAWEHYFTYFIQQLSIQKLDDNLWKKINLKLKEKERIEKEKLKPKKQKLDAQEEHKTEDNDRTETQKYTTLNYYFVDNLKFWQILSAALVALLIISFIFIPKLGANYQWISVLASTQKNQPAAWSITIDSKKQASLKPLLKHIDTSQFDLQLWLNDENDTAKPLLTLNPRKNQSIDLNAFKNLNETYFFQISLEPKNTIRQSQPSGAIIYQGQLIPW